MSWSVPLPKFFRSQAFVLACAVCGFIAFQVYGALTTEPRLTLLLFWDNVSYSVSLLQRLDPQLFSRDSIYANGIFPNSIWLSSYIYMKGLQFFYSLSNENWVMAFSLYHLLLMIPYFLFLMLLMQKILSDRLLAVFMAILAFFPVYFTFTNAIWGMPGFSGARNSIVPEQLLPEALYTVFTPLFVWLIYKFWFFPGAKQQRVRWWWIVGIGALLGASLFLLHSVSGIAAIEIVGVLAILQALRRKLPWSTVAFFTLGAFPLFALRLFGGGSGVPTNLSSLDSQVVMDFGQTFMIFPWRNVWNIQIKSLSFDVRPAIVIAFFAFYHVVSGLTLWSLRTARKRRVDAKLWFLTIQAVYAVLFMSAGYLPIVVLLYGIVCVVKREEHELDQGLLFALIICLWVGPIQQTLLYFVWRLTGNTALTGLIFEMARFQHFAFLPLYLLFGRALWHFTSFAAGHWSRYVYIVSGVLLAYFNLNVKITVTEPFHPVAIALLVYICVLIYYLNRQDKATALVFVKPALLLWMICGIAAGLFGWYTEQEKSANPSSYSAKLAATTNPNLQLDYLITDAKSAHEYETAYLAVTGWAKTNTRKDNLFFLTTFDANFRTLAQRSLLIGYTDTTLPIYSGLHSGNFKILYDEALQKIQIPEQLACFAGTRGVDYLVTLVMEKVQPCVEGSVYYTPQLVFQNQWFTVYQLGKA